MMLLKLFKIINEDETDDEVDETVGSNDGEMNQDDEQDWDGQTHGDEEGAPSWDWTDPYHSSGHENAVLSNKP